ncbi:hypothetical protein BJ912DRAFT_119296 [Pholiota molesta]|nr:hypothetical protein BJ912DRAFT_119296 [Pholiota molesta]
MNRRKQSQSSYFLRYYRTALSLCTAASPILFPLLNVSTSNPHPDRSADLKLRTELDRHECQLLLHAIPSLQSILNVRPGLPSLVDFPVRPSIPQCALHPYLPPVETRTHSKARRHPTNSTTSVLFSEQISCASHRTTKPSAAPSSRKPRPPAPSTDLPDIDAS